MMQEDDVELHQQRQNHNEQETPEVQCTYINQLISEPAEDGVASTAAEYILSSLYQLSAYLFAKTVQAGREEQPDGGVKEMSFNSYLQLMGEDLGKFEKIKLTKRGQPSIENINMDLELMKCYEKVQRSYFQEQFILDLSHFQYFYTELRDKRGSGKARVQGAMEKLYQCLDLVEVNLFSQIHCKFEDYFKVVANFQYLQESVGVHLEKLARSRKALARVNKQFLQKSVRLRRKIIQRQNIEKVLQTIRQVRSIKKLPQVLDSILASSLPYQSLSLLQDTKQVVSELRPLLCLQNISQTVRSMEAMVSNDLTKKHANELYIYLEQCHGRESLNLQDCWRRIETGSCLDKDSSFVLEQLNSSTGSALSDGPGPEDLEIIESTQVLGPALVPRNQGRQYQIAMILLQSYRYVKFSPDVTKMKVNNSLRLFAKRFEKQLLLYLNTVVQNQLQSRRGQKIDKQEEAEKEENGMQGEGALDEKAAKDDEQMSLGVIQKVSVDFYIKHLSLFNQIFRDTIQRLLGYLLTLLTEYEDQLCLAGQKGLENTTKFKDLFTEECGLLPSMLKIVEEKLKYLLTLKNIAGIDCMQFFRWASTLKYWKKYLQQTLNGHPLFTHKPRQQVSDPIKVLLNVAVQSLIKAKQALNLQGLLFDLCGDYLQAFHQNTSQNEVVVTMQEDPWMSTQIPPQFSDILFNILSPEGSRINVSLTILNSSTSSSSPSVLNSSSSSVRQSDEPLSRLKIKLLKNNIQIAGVRYKVNLSVLILCQWLAEYMKVARVLSALFMGSDCEALHTRVRSLCYEKVYDLIGLFCSKSRVLILERKALDFKKIKSKKINAKHMCLLINCLSVIEKIGENLLDQQKLEILKLKSKKEETIEALQGLIKQLLSQLSAIISHQIEKEIQTFKEAEKNDKNISSSKASNSIIAGFLQMVEVTDDYLQCQMMRQVLRSAFLVFSQKYLTHLLLRGAKSRGDAEMIVEKLKFLRKYFPEEYDNLQKQLPK